MIEQNTLCLMVPQNIDGAISKKQLVKNILFLFILFSCLVSKLFSQNINYKILVNNVTGIEKLTQPF